MKTTLIKNLDDIKYLHSEKKLHSFKPVGCKGLAITYIEEKNFDKKTKYKMSFRNRTCPFFYSLCSDKVKIFINKMKLWFENSKLIEVIRCDSDSLTILFHESQEKYLESCLRSSIFTMKQELTNIVQVSNQGLCKTKLLQENGNLVVKIPGLQINSRSRKNEKSSPYFCDQNLCLPSVLVQNNILKRTF